MTTRAVRAPNVMILNGLSVAAVFLSLLELVLGVVALVAALRLRARLRAAPASAGTTASDAVPALFLPGIVLAALAVGSLPLLYMVLVSYVPQWPGVMCVQGVLRIGTGSLGAAGWLPALLGILALTKPLLVVATGAWIVVHLVDRRTRTAPMAPRLVALLALAGGLAIVDASAETAYLAIPKKERFLSSGCCTTPVSTTTADREPASAPPVVGAFVGGAGAAVLAAYAALRAVDSPSRAAARTAAGAALAVAAAGTSLWFLSDVLAPARLHAPGHACLHCLFAAAPDGVVAAGLAATAVCTTAWAAVLLRFSDGTEADPPSRAAAARLLRVALFALPATVVMGLSAWWIA